MQPTFNPAQHIEHTPSGEAHMPVWVARKLIDEETGVRAEWIDWADRVLRDEENASDAVGSLEI